MRLDNLCMTSTFLLVAKISHSIFILHSHGNSRNDLNPNRVQSNAQSFSSLKHSSIIVNHDCLSLPHRLHPRCTLQLRNDRSANSKEACWKRSMHVRCIANAWNIERGRGSRWHETGDASDQEIGEGLVREHLLRSYLSWAMYPAVLELACPPMFQDTHVPRSFYAVQAK